MKKLTFSVKLAGYWTNYAVSLNLDGLSHLNRQRRQGKTEKGRLASFQALVIHFHQKVKIVDQPDQ